ncbi:MAG TPA: hypothetical protein VFB79_22390 [Candidatus Angelobacter sp.]|nr:hypothetical protein [Candidatus Angelobacter sp.]
MSNDLCARGAELFKTASEADDAFKNTLLDFFSSTKKDEHEMQQIEILGARHREADEAFHRHKRFCAICAGASATVFRYVGAD